MTAASPDLEEREPGHVRDYVRRTVEVAVEIHSQERARTERALGDSWLPDEPLEKLRPQRVRDRHDELTRKNGPYSANGAMRGLRAVYRHARSSAPQLPADDPTSAVDWNEEKRRDTALAAAELPQWYAQLAKVSNPIRREFHLFTLLSGMRPDALRHARWRDLDLARRVLHVPSPKGGPKRAFDLPLSRAMIGSLRRLREHGRRMHEEHAREWIFAADVGCIAETKEPREVLAKWGNDLRQTYRTLAVEAGVSELDAMLLMNHKIPGVSAGYITRGALARHLRQQQEKLSRFIVQALQPRTAARR